MGVVKRLYHYHSFPVLLEVRSLMDQIDVKHFRTQDFVLEFSDTKHKLNWIHFYILSAGLCYLCRKSDNVQILNEAEDILYQKGYGFQLYVLEMKTRGFFKGLFHLLTYLIFNLK